MRIKFVVRNPGEKNHLENLGIDWEDNIKTE
jgi:hypothetical protein